MAPTFVRDHVETNIKTSGATNLSVQIGATPNDAGNLLVARIVFDNTSATAPTVSSIAKMAGETNSWVRIAQFNSSSASSGGGIRGEMWAIQTTVQWTANSTYIITLSGSVTAKACQVREYSGATTTLRGTAGTATSTTGVPVATTSGTAPVAGDLVLGFAGWETRTVATQDSTNTLGGAWSAGSDFGTSGGSAATNVEGIGSWKVPTVDGHQSYAPTCTSADSGACIVALVPISPPAAPTSAPTVAQGSAEQITVTKVGTPPSGVTQWKVYREGSAVSGNISTGTASFTDSGPLDATHSYTYTFTWIHPSNGESGQSPTSSGIVPNPAAPTFNLSAGNQKVTINITPRSYSAQYKVYRGLAGGARSLVQTVSAIPIAFGSAATPTVVSSGATGPHTITKPTLNDGDFVILPIVSNQSNATASVTSAPSGFTLARSLQDTGSTLNIYYKYITNAASEPAWDITYSGAVKIVAEPVTYTGVHSTTPLGEENGNIQSGTSTDLATPTVNYSAGDMYVVVGSNRDGTAATWTWPGGETERADASVTGSSQVSMAIADKGPQASAGSVAPTTSSSFSSGNAEAWVGILKPQSSQASWTDTGLTNETAYDYTVSTLVATPTSRESSQSSIQSSTPTATKTFSIATGSDDGYGINGTNITPTSSTAFAGRVSTDIETAYYRFTGITFLQGTTVSSATLHLHSTLAGNGSPVLRVWAEAADNSAQITAGGQAETRPRTTALKDITPPITNNVDIDIDVTNIIQEVLNRSGWASGNAIQFFIEDLLGVDNNYIAVGTFEAIAGSRPSLIITEGAAAPPVTASDTLSASVTETANVQPPVYPGIIPGIMPEGNDFAGPIKDTNGNLYVITESDLASGNKFKAMKSTTDGITWFEQDTTGVPATNDLESVWVVQDKVDSSILHVFQQDGSRIVFRHEFQMSDGAAPDTWTVTDEVIYDPAVDPTDQQVSAVCDNNGDLYVFYRYEPETVGGARERIRYSKKPHGGSWGTPQVLHDGLAADITSAAPVVGAGNKIHIFYQDQTNATLYHRSLTSAGVLSAAEVVNDTALNAKSHSIIAPVYVDVSGVERIVVGWANATGVPKYAVIDNDGTPGAEATITNTAVKMDPSGLTSRSVTGFMDTDGTNIVFAFSDAATQDIWYTQTTKTLSGWSAEVEARDGVTANWCYVRIWQSPLRIGILYDDGSLDDVGQVRYDEYALTTATPIVASDTLSINVTGIASVGIKANISASDTLSASVSESNSIAISGQIDKSAFDNTLTSISESVATKATTTANDALSVAVAETRQFGTITITASDTLSAGTTEVSSFATVPIVASDSLTTTLIESTGFATVAVIATDTLNAQDTEAISFATVTVTANDTLSANITESVITFVNEPAADSLNALVTESSQIAISGLVTKSASDTLSTSVTDIGNFPPTPLSTSDTLSASVASTATMIVSITASDTLTLTYSQESPTLDMTGLFTYNRSDFLNANVIETANVSASVFNPNDDLLVDVIDIGQIDIQGLVSKSGFDAIQASVSESIAFGVVTVLASDNLNASVNDNLVFATTNITANDNLNAGTTENLSFATVNISSIDTLNININDASIIAVASPGSDSLVASLNDTSSLIISGVTNLSASDSLSAIVVDTRNLIVVVNSDDLSVTARVTESVTFNAQSVTASDTLNANVIENITFATVEVDVNDNLNAAVTDAGTIFQPATGTDSLITTLSETSNIVPTGGADKTGFDTLVFSYTDSATLRVPIVSSDNLNASVSDSLAFAAVPVVASEMVLTGLTESVSFATVSVNANDVILAAISEIALNRLDRPGLDFLDVKVTDTANVTIAGGLVDKSSIDTLVITLSESINKQETYTITSVDDLLIRVTEAVHQEFRANREHRAADWIIGVDRIWTGKGWRSKPRRP